MRSFRLFVSSPGDAMRERQRVERVCARLNAEFAGTAQLEAVRWETRFYQAFATFQSQIAMPADCDIVVAIFRARLGTALPPGFQSMEDGEPYPSGTAYEVLTAIHKRQSGSELPDIYVFRYPNPPSVTLDDETSEREVREQWEKLKAFFARWFVTPQGQFKAAFQTFASTDDFEAQLERLLREWLAQRVAQGRAYAWPIATKGSPFPGLQAFGAKHAPVFFGRTRDIVRGVDLWRAAAARGCPFLLIVGPSGAGKSSLARAGLLPRFTSPGVVADIDVWRTAVMRPSDHPAGSINALAEALLETEAKRPAEEQGRVPALPEIAQGPYKTPEQLAGVLGHADAAATRPVLEALALAGEQERAREGFERSPRCDLALLIDQLDEIFAASVTPEDRARFARLLDELLRSGRVWIVATLRADLYELFLREGSLFALKERGATLDLATPGIAELAEIIRKPAQAAGLVYARDAATGETLDERLLADADRPDMLPLVQLALSRLYEARETAGDEVRLTLAAYAGLGGMSGIIDKVGEEAVARLDPVSLSRLPRLIRLLAERSGQGSHSALTVRSVPLAPLFADEPMRGLAAALIEARLLMTTGAGGQLRLSHQRVLSDWNRARQIVDESADFYRIRGEVDARRLKWEEANKRPELLLARGLPLSEAESIATKYRDEMAPEMLAFIAASRRRANIGFVLTAAAAAVFAVLAIGAGIAAKVAKDERARAESNFDAAKRTVDGLIFDVAQGLQDVSGMRVETVRRVLDTVKRTVDDLVTTEPDNPELQRSRAGMLANFVDTYLKAGDVESAIAAGNEGLAVARNLLARAPADSGSQRLLTVSLYKLGDARLRANDAAGALDLYEQSLMNAQALAQRTGLQTERVLWVSTVKIGDAKFARTDASGALASYERGLALARMRAALDERDPEAQRDLSISQSKVGDARLALGDTAGALTAYGASLAIRRALAQRDPDNTQAERDVALDLNKIGAAKLQAGDRQGAVTALEEGVAILRALAAQDRGNARAQRDVAVALLNIGDVRSDGGDAAGALSTYEEGLAILRALLALDRGNVQAQSEVAVALTKTASVSDNAAVLYREALAILDALAATGKLSPEQESLREFIKVLLAR
jgi:tetratricopeptide (TPR) repeat protein